MDESILSFFLDNFGIQALVVAMMTYALFLLITNLPKILDSITYFQSRKIKHITEALNSEWVEDNYKKILKKDISKLYLSGTLKIKASEKQVREIIEVLDILKGSCSAKDVYTVIKNMPNEFYKLSLYDLKQEKKKQEKRIYYEKIMCVFFVFVVPSFYIVYLYIHVAKNNYYWEWTFQNYFLIVIPILTVSMNIISFAMFARKDKSIMGVLNGVISSIEDNGC